jgi:NTE family protein
MTSWSRERRRSQFTEIQIEHIMASAAIPILFAPVAIADRFYGDGCLRNASPLSSAIHLGSRRLLIVGVRKQSESMKRLPDYQMPAFGRILSVLLNAILLDTTDFDVERLSRINQTLALISEGQKEKTHLREIDYVWITPSKDIGLMAKQSLSQLPFALRYLLRGLGSKSESSEIASYLLFESEFCKRLIELGYSDALARKSELESLFDKP